MLGVACLLTEFVLLGPRPRRPPPEQVRANLARLREPYCAAFVRHCLAYVYPPAGGQERPR